VPSKAAVCDRGSTRSQGQQQGDGEDNSIQRVVYTAMQMLYRGLDSMLLGCLQAEAAGGDGIVVDAMKSPANESSTTASAALMDHTDEDTDDGLAHMSNCGLSAMLSHGHHNAEHVHEHGERVSQPGSKSNLERDSRKSTGIEKAIKSLITPKYGRGSHDGDRDSAGHLHASGQSFGTPPPRTHGSQSQPAGAPGTQQVRPSQGQPLSPDSISTYIISATAAPGGAASHAAASMQGPAENGTPGGVQQVTAAAAAGLAAATAGVAAAGRPPPVLVQSGSAPRAAQSVSLPAAAVVQGAGGLPGHATGQRAQLPPVLLVSAGSSAPIAVGSGTALALVSPGPPQVLGRSSTGVPPASLSRTSWVTEYMSCADNTSWVSSK
jgi:hypothetical protein